ncbi:MAG TPA: hypothetical protein VJ507_03430 [Candidatus Bathyarchaeia archaeon]|nr:hypothetical protein [Candidatus Bathyarchaeia archaeon]
MEIYEYLFAAILIVAMLIGSTIMVSTIAKPTQNVSDNEQLKVAAQKVATQVLLDTGYPFDWGSDITLTPSDLMTFGLAKHGETTREAYTLDSNKIKRLKLDFSSPYYVSPSTVLNLLNLGTDYGFSLEIYAPLNVSLYPIDGNHYAVNVLSQYAGLPVVNAIVNATMFYSEGASPINTANAVVTPSFNGTYSLDFQGQVPATEKKIMIVAVDYSSIRVTRAFNTGSDVVIGNMLGENLLLSQPLVDEGAEIREIIVTKKNGTAGCSIGNISSTLTEESPTRFRTAYLEPYTVATVTNSKNGSLILTSEDAALTYSSIPETSSFPSSYSIERTVMVGGSTYSVRLQLWRMTF